MRKSCVLLLCVVLLVSGLIGTVPAEPINDVKISQITYINTDWIVSDVQVRENEIIVLTGNLIIQSGGDLTLRNTTLKLNCSSSDGEYYIEVQSGGLMKILDGDENNLTTNDASWITANNTDYEFNFWVRDGAQFEMRNSKLSECGYFWGGVHEKEGLFIQTDDAIIDHNNINNCTRGVVLYGSDAIVSNNTIEWNEYGSLTTAWSNGTIENNVIDSNEKYGIRVDGVDNTKKWSSNPLIRGNRILNTGRGISTANALHIQDYSSPTIVNNEIINYTEDGIYFGEWCQATVEDTLIDAEGGNYGIVGSVPRTVRLTNCTIRNTAILDVLGGTSYFIFTNTSFNKSKVDFFDSVSNLTNRYYLHTYTGDHYGNPVAGAEIRIRDNSNGTYDENFTTDANGHLNWTVLKEYYQNKSTKILYTPYNITVEKGGYLTAYAQIEMTQSRYITITLQADEPPIADAGPDQSVNEDEKVNFNGSGSTDDVEILWYNWTFGDGNNDYGTNITTNHTYTNAGTYIVTLNVTDTIGQWDEDTALVFVNNVGPNADAGSNMIGDEGQPILFDGSASTDTPSDQSNLTYTWYFGDGKTDTGIIVNHSYEDDGIYTATLVVTDDNGFVDSDEITVTVNNVAPSIEPVPAQTIMEDSLFTLQINASDVPADSLTFSDNTTLFDINQITGLIEFTLTNDDVGNHSVNVTVMDDDGGLNYTVLNVTVLNTNDPPTIEFISQQSTTEDIEFTLQIVAEDVDVGDVLTYSLTTSPTGMSVDGTTGLITWTPTNDDVGTHTVTVKVEDASGLYDTETFAIIVSNVNDAPMIITDSLANATEDVFYMAYIQADDVDADTLRYSLDTYPAFLSIDPINGLLFGTPDNGDVGAHNVVANVTDGDTYVTKTFSLIVANVNDVPIIASTPILTADVNEKYVYDVVASDIDTDDVLTFSLVEGPEGMGINGTKITWTPSNEQQGKTYQVVVEVSDGDATAKQSFIVSVVEMPEGTNVWLTLILGLVGGLIGAVVMNWVMRGRRKEKAQEYIEEIEDVPEAVF